MRHAVHPSPCRRYVLEQPALFSVKFGLEVACAPHPVRRFAPSISAACSVPRLSSISARNSPAARSHLCRGNRGGSWHSEGSYDSVADRLFNALNIPFYFLEYDSPRAGTFTPLRLVPRHKTVVLGLVSTKTPALEHKDELKKRIEDATRHLDLDNLAISPQCGFASVDTGNPITPEVQEQKLRLVVELARDIWGEA